MGATWAEDPSPDELRKENDDVLRAIAHAPRRIMGFVYVSPKHVDASLTRDGPLWCATGPMLGVKLWGAMHCNRPELDPIVRRAVELQVPVLQTLLSPRRRERAGRQSSAADLAVLAARHPDASFVCAHTDNDWERGIREIRTLKNIVAEVSGSDPTAGFAEMAVRELGAERVVFGSDAGGRSFASQLAKVLSADLPEDARCLVLGGNIRRLLQPILRRKGA